MKKLKLVLMGLLVALMANATDELKQFDRIAIELKDGTYYEIPINSSSYIYSCVEGTGTTAKQIVQVKGDNCEYKFDRDEIKTMKCVELVSGIKDIIVEDIEKLRYEDGRFKIDSSLIGEYLSVYDLAGRMVLYTKINNKPIISIDYLPEGIYIAKINDQTIKVAVK